MFKTMSSKIFSIFIFVFIFVSSVSAQENIDGDPSFSSSVSPLDSIKSGEEFSGFDLREFIDYSENDSILRVAVVLSDIYSKKDMEFTRGMLMGIKQAKLPQNSISLKVINGEIPADSLEYEMELFGPHLIVSTFEKDFPGVIRTYIQQNNTTLLNIFDARGTDYIYNPNVFQLLSPSDKFNERITRYILDNFKGNVLVMIGDPDPTDPSIRELILYWPEEDIMILSKEDLPELILEEETNYVFYPLFSSNEDVREVLKQTKEKIIATPSAGLKIFGRPNWIAFSDLNSMIDNLEIFIPAKVYFDPSKERGKRFIAGYNSMFGHAPIRSYPVYAVMGYDASMYFLPKFLSGLRDGEIEWDPENMDQSYFSLKKSEGGGFYNNGVFILHYEPWGTMQKETID